jgi:hypothetical protein
LTWRISARSAPDAGRGVLISGNSSDPDAGTPYPITTTQIAINVGVIIKKKKKERKKERKKKEGKEKRGNEREEEKISLTSIRALGLSRAARENGFTLPAD